MLEIGAALSALKGTLDLATGALAARDDAKVKEAISAMASRFIDAQTSVIAMSEQIRSLQSQLTEANQQLVELKQRQTEREQYVLDEVTPGNFAYRSKRRDAPAVVGGIPVHHLCQPCFDKGQKSVLARRESASFGASLLCPTCKHEISVDGFH